jgi:hypothetical protein
MGILSRLKKRSPRRLGSRRNDKRNEKMLQLRFRGLDGHLYNELAAWSRTMDNPTIADELLKQARTAADEGANLYRVRALRRAALVVQSLDRPVATILAHDGLHALLKQPGIGSHLAKRIAELALRN